jgi:hypothetical protein
MKTMAITAIKVSSVNEFHSPRPRFPETVGNDLSLQKEIRGAEITRCQLLDMKYLTVER